MNSTFQLELWSLKKLSDLAKEGKLDKLPHQREIQLKSVSVKRLIKSALNGNLLQNFIFCDLKSSYDSSIDIKNKEFFGTYIKKGKEYSIEDCQHRMGALQNVRSEDFNNTFYGRENEFWEIKVPVLILKNTLRPELIDKFGEVNGGKTVNNDNLMWGVDNHFNETLKNIFIEDEDLLRLYKTKKKSTSVERILYGNIVRILKICGAHENIVSSANTSGDSLKTFIESNLDINLFDKITCIFPYWYDLIKNYKNKDTFVAQSNLFFILHILKITFKEWDEDEIHFIFSQFNDTRSSGQKRYENILNYITSEEYTNARSLATIAE